MAASGAQGAGLGGDDELAGRTRAHDDGSRRSGLRNQGEEEEPAGGGDASAPDPLAGLGQTNVRALAARAIVPGAELWDVAHWPKNRRDKPKLAELKAEILWRDRAGKTRPARDNCRIAPAQACCPTFCAQSDGSGLTPIPSGAAGSPSFEYVSPDSAMSTGVRKSHPRGLAGNSAKSDVSGV